METPTKCHYSPNNILAHLEELKKWQELQQQRLIYQQQRQRDLLSNEQHRIYKAFGLNVVNSPSRELSSIPDDNSRLNSSDYELQNSIINDLVNNCNSDNSIILKDDLVHIQDNLQQKEHDESFHEQNTCSKSLCNNDNINEVISKEDNENVLNMNSFLNGENNKSQIIVDEIPICTSNKNFNELIEEHIKDEDKSVININKTKRPFLKRGQGLARFRLTNSDLETIRSKANEKSKTNKVKFKSNQKNKGNSFLTKTCSSISVDNTNKKFNLSDKTPSNKTIVKKRNLNFKENSKSTSLIPNQTRNTKNNFGTSMKSIKKPIIKVQTFEQDNKIRNAQEIVQTIGDVKSTERSKSDTLVTKPITWSEILQEQNQHTNLQEVNTKKDYTLNTEYNGKQQTGTYNTVINEENFENNKENIPKNAEISNFTNTESDISLATCERLISELNFKKDQEELKIFELLEEKAANSSFCSTSSIVQQLMNKSLIPSPKLAHFQLKFQRHNYSDTDSTPNCSPQKINRPPLRKRLIPKKNERLHVHFEDIDGNSINHNMKTNLETTNESESYTSLIIENNNTNSTDQNNEVNSDSNIIELQNFNDNSIWSGSSTSDDSELNSTLQDEKETVLNVQLDNDKVIVGKKEQLNISKQIDDDVYTKDVIFKSALLKSRLQELEKEIEIFKSENEKLAQQKSDFETEKKIYTKKKFETEKKLAEEKKRIDFFFTEEKKKLAKEKIVFEKYSKEVKNNPNRKEREEISMLKQEINELKEEIKVKDSRHGASQARLRNQIKNLEKEMSKVKNENDNLKKENKKLQSTQKRNMDISNTRMLHEINKNLSKIIPHEIKSIENISNKKHGSKITSDVLKITTPKSCLRTSNTETSLQIENLELESSDDSKNDSEIDDTNKLKTPNKLGIESTAHNAIFPKKHIYFSNSGISDDEKSTEEISFSDKTQSSKEDINFYNEENRELEVSKKIALEYEKMFGKSDSVTNEQVLKTNSFDNSNLILSSDIDALPTKSYTVQTNMSDESLSSCFNTSSSSINITDTKEHIREIIYPNGKKEIHYTNGNIKITSADGKIVKLLYYNEDIKETDLVTGTIKYFYAKTKTWHTTYIDGLEILEFNNGQVEKKFKDGSYEIKFPDKSVKYIDAEGNEKFEFCDGSTAITNLKGEKIITFINGQKEIHTHNHKRREYPNGTVKILYPDDTTETRYFNGRIRIRDKYGNLLMDSGAPQ